MAGVLAGIRVIDFGRYVAGPYCATLLGYLGADVIRVERPEGGEDRFIAPVTEQGEGAVFLQTACNKRSVSLKPTSDGGREIVRRLVAGADVVVANLPAPALSKIGIDFASLQAIKPELILANVTAFGNSGPWATRGGFDGIGQAMSGAMVISGTPGAPMKAAAPYVDYTTAVLAAFGVMAALKERELTGRGQEISGTLLGTAQAVFNSHLVEEGVLGLGRVGTGNRVQTSAPSDVFETRDGHVLVHCPSDALFRRFVALMGDVDEWLEDPRFQTDQSRGDHRDVICERMARWCRERTTDDVLTILAERSIPAGPVLSPREALAHPQTAAVGVLGSVDYPGLSAAAPVADLPFTMSVTETGIDRRPPTVGEHTDEVLAELGFDAAEIAAFRAKGVL